MPLNLGDFLSASDFFNKLPLTKEQRQQLVLMIEEEFLLEFLANVISESEEILAIDPTFARQEILERAAQKIVKDLNAAAASIRLFDPKSFKMLTFGAHGLKDTEREAAIPVKSSIAGKVIENNKSIIVPNIMENPLFKSKRIAAKKGFNSLMAVPLRMPSFVGSKEDILGSLQIYYTENNRYFTRQEIIRAEMLARRVSYVMAKKRILDMREQSNRKEKISDKIFYKLSNHEGIKLKDLFSLTIPELDEFLQLYSCSLFTMSEDRKSIYQEASHPANHSFHKLGQLLPLRQHEYLWAAVYGAKEEADMLYERFDPLYILIKDPLKSEIVGDGLQKFAKEKHIHSILLVPLKVKGVTRHILCFFATQQKQYFSEDEIDLLTFFGKEIMKALKFEFLAEMLHDFKNPAIAVAGLAARSKKYLEAEDINPVRGKLVAYLDIIAREASRLQDLSLTITGEGREEEIDLGELAGDRYRLNEYLIRETTQKNVLVKPLQIEAGMIVLCPLDGLKRVLDNILNNATKAIPEEGGFIEMRGCISGKNACLEIINSGEIPSDQAERVNKGEAGGRGLNIVYRFIQNNHGDVSIQSNEGVTAMKITLPLHRSSAES